MYTFTHGHTTSELAISIVRSFYQIEIDGQISPDIWGKFPFLKDNNQNKQTQNTMQKKKQYLDQKSQRKSTYCIQRENIHKIKQL